MLADLRRVQRRLDTEDHVLVHRDLQSSNILFFRGEPVLLDFQGMRLGPSSYDLASLLCDPYVNLDPGIQRDLITYYASHTRRDPATFSEQFWHVSPKLLF